MAETLTVQITAQDGVTKVFKAISSSAQDVGEKVESAGKRGEQGLKRIDDGAQKAKLGMQDLGAALTALGAGMAKAGDMALNQERLLISLRRAYGDAADEMISFADEMANVTIFNDDDILAGERFFATLRNNYGLTVQEIQGLMEITADLASSAGVSFEDASNRVTAAIRGEAEAAEFLGLTMNQQAIDRENLTLSMSNQEAAQFRLNALYQQAAPYQGTAAALMESEVGTRAKLTNAIQDNAQAAANFVGPLAMTTAGLALASSGVATFVGTASRAVTTLRSSSLAMGALGAATNPVVLGLGALAVAGIATWSMFNEGRESAERLEDALIQLGDVAQNLRLAYRDDEASFLDQFSEGITGLQDDLENLDMMAVVTQIATLRGQHPQLVFDEISEGMKMTSDESDRLTLAIDEIGKAFANSQVDAAALDADLDKLFAAYQAREITFDEFLAGLEDITSNLPRYRAEIDGATTSTANFGDQLDRLRGLASGSAGGVDELTGSVNRIEAALEDGSLSAETLNAYMAELDRQMATGAITWAQYQERVENVDDALLGLSDAFGEALGASVLGAAVTSVDDITTATEEYAAAAQQAEEHTRAFGDALGVGIRGSLDATQEDIDAYRALVADFAAGMLALAGDGDFLSQWNMTGMASEASRLAESINDVSAALDNTQRVIIGNTNAIGSQMQGLEDWALELINVRGIWGEIDDLYNEGRISLDKYNQAQIAQEQISASNATIQRDILAIQAAQAPIMGDLAERQAAYVQSLREMNDGINDTATGARDQLAALGMMDDAMVGQVQQFTEMVSLMGQLGPAGAESMQTLIDGIVATDPVMTAMLEKMGLIREVSEGKYELNLDAADAMDSIGRLTESIDALTIAMGGVPPSLDIEVDADTSQADATVRDWATLGYTGGYMPEIPVDADTGPAAASLAAFEPPTINVPVAFTSALGGGLLGAAQDAAGALNIPEIVVPAPDTSEANAAIDGVEANLADLDGNTAMTYINVLDSASATILDVGSLIAGLDSATATVNINANAANAYAEIANMQAYNGSVLATTYVNIVTRAVGSSLSSQRHGGIPGYASGGVLFEAAEAGAELAYFAGGGVALLPTHGLYSAPSGTYISPANANSGITYGGTTVNVTVQGNVYGIDDLIATTTEALAPALGEVARNALREQGVNL